MLFLHLLVQQLMAKWWGSGEEREKGRLKGYEKWREDGGKGEEDGEGEGKWGEMRGQEVFTAGDEPCNVK